MSEASMISQGESEKQNPEGACDQLVLSRVESKFFDLFSMASIGIDLDSDRSMLMAGDELSVTRGTDSVLYTEGGELRLGIAP